MQLCMHVQAVRIFVKDAKTLLQSRLRNWVFKTQQRNFSDSGSQTFPSTSSSSSPSSNQPNPTQMFDMTYDNKADSYLSFLDTSKQEAKFTIQETSKVSNYRFLWSDHYIDVYSYFFYACWFNMKYR